jgi:hypothetical protein
VNPLSDSQEKYTLPDFRFLPVLAFNVMMEELK